MLVIITKIPPLVCAVEYTSVVVGRVVVLSEKIIHNAPNARAASNIFITEIIKFLFMENMSKIIIGIFVKKTMPNGL